MKNKFIQKEFGKCVHYCIANAFNKPEAIDIPQSENGGLSWVDARAIIESITGFSTKHLLCSNVAIDQYLPLFEVDEDVSGHENLYIIFIVTIDSDIDVYRHCILVIKENFNKTLTVLDPKNRFSEKVNVDRFFGTYKPYEIEVIVHKEVGGIMFFNQPFLSHLFS